MGRYWEQWVSSTLTEALIVVVTHDTLSNRRSEGTRLCLESIAATVDLGRHRLVVVDNGSDDPETLELLHHLELGSHPGVPLARVCRNGANLGTARAFNVGLRQRLPGEAVVKCDNDVVLRDGGWLEQALEVFRRRPDVGLLGLKRQDLPERPDHPPNADGSESHFKTRLELLAPPNQIGRWIPIELVRDPVYNQGEIAQWKPGAVIHLGGHVIGTVHIMRPEIVDQLGGLYQHGTYGFDDSLYNVRVSKLGYKRAFLPHFLIDHWEVDPPVGWVNYKVAQADAAFAWFREEERRILAGEVPLYWDLERETYGNAPGGDEEPNRAT